MRYTYRIWCAEAVRGQVEGGAARYYHEEVGGSQKVVFKQL